MQNQFKLNTEIDVFIKNDSAISVADDGELFNKLYKLVFKASPADDTILSNDEFNLNGSIASPYSISIVSTAGDHSPFSQVSQVEDFLEGFMHFERVQSQAIYSCPLQMNECLRINSAILSNKYSFPIKREIFVSGESTSGKQVTLKEINQGTTHPLSLLFNASLEKGKLPLI